MAGPIERITNILNGVSTSRAAAALLKVPYVLAASNVAVPNTGSTTENTLATITIPAGALGLNGIIRLTTIWTFTSSANNKILRYRLGGAAGTVWLQHTATTTAGLKDQHQFGNRGVANSQIAGPITTNNSFTASTNGATAMSIDTSAAQDIVITAQLASAGETITLEHYLVELIIP